MTDQAKREAVEDLLQTVESEGWHIRKYNADVEPEHSDIDVKIRVKREVNNG